ncbi:unnamed protein product, partial [Cylicostephanus goldi]
MGEQQPGPASVPKSDEFVVVKEGKAKIGFHGPVFYNPVQEFNRDLTVSVLRQFVRLRKESHSNGAREDGEGEPNAKKMKLKDASSQNGPIRILDALSASGLRALRFSQEVRVFAIHFSQFTA